MQGERKPFHSYKNWRGETFFLFRFLAMMAKGIFPYWREREKARGFLRNSLWAVNPPVETGGR